MLNGLGCKYIHTCSPRKYVTLSLLYFLKSCSFCIHETDMHVCILVTFYYVRECHSWQAFKNNLSDRATRSTEENHLLFLPRPSSLSVLVPLFLSTSFFFFLHGYTEAHMKEGKELPA